MNRYPMMTFYLMMDYYYTIYDVYVYELDNILYIIDTIQDP